ncbi:YjbH domain-containing protein [Pseudobowmanella zhangzhouensis]|uniref:YjbH domain-containing protein n=1 Tax=Pseudobowmanella zhangzhouensis TaxID=1537679 RepID=A0ABW1XQP2_9ALTE
MENFDKFNYTLDTMPTPLPRVRTNMREYVTRSTVTLENLFGHSFFRMDENSFGQVYAGYLESMYAGVGAEWLYRPVDANWSFGVDLNYVTQRSYESEFELFDYKAFTGHVNVTYEPTLDMLSNTRISIKVTNF